MFDLRRAHRVLGIVMASLFCVARLHTVKAQEENPLLALSLDEFTHRVLGRSLRSQTAHDNLRLARWSYMAALRKLTWPSLGASATESKNHLDPDTDTGVLTNSRTEQGSLSLSQPFLTGANLSLTGTWSRNQTISSLLGSDSETFGRIRPALTASVSQPVYVFQRNPSLRTRTESSYRWQNDQDNFEREVLDIAASAHLLYYTLLQQMATVEVERNKAESARLVHDATEALVRAGKLAEVELVRADIRAKGDQRRIQNAESGLEQTANQAKDLLLLSADVKLALTSKLTYSPFTIPLDRLSEAASKHNPSLQVAQRGIALSKISLERSREGNRPQLNTSGNYSWTRDQSNPDLPLQPRSWTVAAGVTWPFFDAYQTPLAIRQQEVALANAERSYESQLRQLKVLIQNAYLDLKRTEEQISDFQQQREQAQRNVVAIRLQYENGLTRLTDVFDAENELRNLELEHLGLLVSFNKDIDQLVTLVGVDLATIGEGWLP